MYRRHAARNLGAHLPMRGFIGAERRLSPPHRMAGRTAAGQRWLALGDWLPRVKADGFPWSKSTALRLVSTRLLGARGRIDASSRRPRGGHSPHHGGHWTAGSTRRLSTPSTIPHSATKNHPFTGDNRYYLAYFTLMGWAAAAPPRSCGRAPRRSLSRFETLWRLCDGRRARMSASA
jgi:hypothetical protein